MQDPDQVRRWVSEAEAEVAQLIDESETVMRRLSEARRRLSLLHEILAAVSKDPTAAKTAIEPISTRERVIRDTLRILGDAGKPMAIGAIHAEFIRRGYALPGRGSPTNLVAHLGKTDRVARLARGVYGTPERPKTEPDAVDDRADAAQE
jgi:hypothetical protein